MKQCSEEESSTNLVLLDSDVFIHFCRIGQLDTLCKVFKNRLQITVEVVSELSSRPEYEKEIEDFIKKNNICKIDLKSDRDYMYEFFILRKTFDTGECSCMAAAKVQNKSIASSNIRDVNKYCSDNKINNYPFMEILLLAVSESFISEIEGDLFISGALSNGARLPATNLADYRKLININ